MKKALSLVLALALTAGCTICGCAEVKKHVTGDINGDGKVDVADISLVAAHIKGVKTLSEEQQFYADLKFDGKLTVTDLVKLAAYIKCKDTSEDIISKIEANLDSKGYKGASVFVGENEVTGKYGVTVLINTRDYVSMEEMDKYNAEIVESIKAFVKEEGCDPDMIQFNIAE